MTFDGHANFAISTVATAPSPATTGTSLVLAAGTGSLMPVAPFNATVWANGQTPTSSNSEIVRVTARSTDTLTITRAQELSSARTVITGDQFMAGITKKTLTDIESAIGTGGGGGGTGLPEGWFDVTAYGAVGDGSTDSTTAFQSAINAASVGASSGYFFGGGVVYVPPASNQYIVSNLTFNVSGLTFKGAGLRSSVVAQKAGSSGSMIKPATINSTTSFKDLLFEDIYFTGGNNTGGSNTVGVELTSCQECRFHRAGFGWFTLAGILAQCGPNGGSGVNDSIAHNIYKCVFENSVAPAPGVLFRTNPADLAASGQGYSTIDSCWFNGNGNDNVAIGGQMTKLKITNNHFMGVVVPLQGIYAQSIFMGNTHENFGYVKTSTGLSGVYFDFTNNGPGNGTSTGYGTFSTIMAFNHYAVPNVANQGVTIAKPFVGLQRVFDGGGYGVFAFVTELWANGTSFGVGDTNTPPF